jgi:hypothetical protein
MWLWVKGCDVVIDRNIRPVLTKNPLAIWLAFNKRYCFKSANYALSGVTKAANPAEGVKQLQRHPPYLLSNLA